MFSSRARSAALFVALSFSPVVLAAAPALTTIQDMLYKADGTRFQGVVDISWNGFQAADASNIPTQHITLNIKNGYLRVQLVPSTNANPAGSYTVVYNSDGVVQFTETWSVPPSSTALRVGDVRTSIAAGVASALQVQVSDVSGLTAELSVRPSMGPGYAPSRAAIIDGGGNISAAIGNLSDCVHVDGTSGPCGSGGGSGSGAVATNFVDAEIPNGSLDGVNSVFMLTNAPSPITSLSLYVNGLAMQQGTDYILSGQIISFLRGSIPQAGDILQAFYRTAAGGSSVNQTDLAGQISLASASSATHTFAASHSTAPVCVVSPGANMGATTWWSSSTTSGVTVYVSAPGTFTFNYMCSGQ